MNANQAPLPQRLVEGEGSPQEKNVGEALRAFRALTDVAPSEASGSQVLHAMRKDASRRFWIRGVSAMGVGALVVVAFIWGYFRNETRSEVVNPPKQEISVVPNETPVLTEPEPQVPLALPVKATKRPSIKATQTDESDSLLEESRLLMKVSSAMNGQDFPQALELLNEYDLRFPEGTLRVEAKTSRAKVYLVQAQFDEARQVVEQLKPLLGASSRGNELQLFESELWAARNQCSEALGILEKMNSASLSAKEHERELWVKSNCHLKLGSKDEALRNLQRYLSEFPQGQFSTQAAALLENLK